MRTHLARLQAIHLCPTHSGSDQSASCEATTGSYCMSYIHGLAVCEDVCKKKAVTLTTLTTFYDSLISNLYFFESYCPFPNSFQWQRPIWFCITKHPAQSDYLSSNILRLALVWPLTPIKSITFMKKPDHSILTATGSDSSSNINMSFLEGVFIDCKISEQLKNVSCQVWKTTLI